MRLTTWDENRIDEIQNWDKKDREKHLFIEKHPNYDYYLLVSSLDPLLAFKLKDPLGEYLAIHSLKLNHLLEVGEAKGYEEAIFLQDPNTLFEWLDELNAPYPYELGVELKKFQTQGFNFTKDLESCLINWSTGTGKSIYAVARAKYLLETDQIDKVVIASKNHNKINWQRTFDEIGQLEAGVGEAPGNASEARRERRRGIYEDSRIFIVNYEKFRYQNKNVKSAGGDGKEIESAVSGKRVLWLWDEMPSKMKRMSTRHYRGVQKILGSTDKNFQCELTATKIETDPENVYACTKVLDPTIWPNLQNFRKEYAKSFSTFSPWQVATWDKSKLRELGMRLSHITHVANKYTDPDVAAEFPEEHWDNVIIDMSAQDRKLYKAALDEIIEHLPVEMNSVLTKMNVLQQICNNPATVSMSEGELAKALSQLYIFNDSHCAKLDVLKDYLNQIDGKIVLFSMYNPLGAQMLKQYLMKWDVSFVLYDGTAKQKQAAEDKFRADPNIRVFVSSDQGSDSINLEMATTVINYDLPWNYSTLTQRVNRINRLTTQADHVYYYNFIMADTIEERKLKILERKRGYEEAIDKDTQEIAEILSKTSMNELKWILTG